jgi:hypothetical protein
MLNKMMYFMILVGLFFNMSLAVEGDFNQDEIVDLIDLSLLSENWLQDANQIDLNDDDIINNKDFGVLSKNWLENNMALTHITSVDELFSIANNPGSYTISANHGTDANGNPTNDGVYYLAGKSGGGADIIFFSTSFAGDPTFELTTIHESPSLGGDGNVTIHGSNLWSVSCRNKNQNVDTVININVGGSGRLIFTNPGATDPAMEVGRTRDRHPNIYTVRMDNCDFQNSTSSNGFEISNDEVRCYVTLNNCTSHDNDVDGYNVGGHIGDDVDREVILTLNDCKGYNNSPTTGSGGKGDALTLHDTFQKIIVNGGEYYNNGKGGMVFGNSARGSGIGIIRNAWFHNNGRTGNNGLGDIYPGEGDIYIYNTRFTGLNDTSGEKSVYHFNSADDDNAGKIIADGCIFEEPDGGGTAIMCSYGHMEIRNSIFRNFITAPAQNHATYGLSQGVIQDGLPGGGTISIEGCIFYNCLEAITMVNANPSVDSNITLKNNIFHSCTTAIHTVAYLAYRDDPENNRENLFWNCTNNFLDDGEGTGSKAQRQANFNDMVDTINPQFNNPTSNDFRVLNKLSPRGGEGFKGIEDFDMGARNSNSLMVGSPITGSF